MRFLTTTRAGHAQVSWPISRLMELPSIHARMSRGRSPCARPLSNMNSATRVQGHRLARNPILVETTSSKTEKVPPKPQHSSSCAGVTNSMPATFESRSIGLEKTGSRNSEGVACLSWRRVPQLLCSPTRCGKLAHGAGH
jgi:hypothetical protein